MKIKAVVDFISVFLIIIEVLSVVFLFRIVGIKGEGVPAPLVISVVNVFPCAFSVCWLLFRHGPKLIERYPLLGTVKFRIWLCVYVSLFCFLLPFILHAIRG